MTMEAVIALALFALAIYASQAGSASSASDIAQGGKDAVSGALSAMTGGAIGGGTQEGFTNSGLSADVEILARTLYGEARAVNSAALGGVASVIRNRWHLGPVGGFGIGWVGVCKQRNQFSCWNTADMAGTTAAMLRNRAAMLAVPVTDPAFQNCVQFAQWAIAGELVDTTGGALFYHDHTIAEPASWVKAGYRLTVTINPFTFYKGRFL